MSQCLQCFKALSTVEAETLFYFLHDVPICFQYINDSVFASLGLDCAQNLKSPFVSTLNNIIPKYLRAL